MRSVAVLVVSTIPMVIGCRLLAGVDDKQFVDGAGAQAGAGATGRGGSQNGGGGSGGGTAGADASVTSSTSASGGASGACLTLCNRVCTDTLSDAAHCGACDVACAAGETCDGGICRRALFRGPGTGTLCATKPNGTMYCWGSNQSAEAFLGAAGDPIPTPVPIETLSGPVRYAAGTGFATCALMKSGAVYCVGNGDQVGNGMTVGGPDPCADLDGCVATPYPALTSGIVEIAGAGDWTGGSHFCARNAGGTVLCWGDVGGCTSTIEASWPAPVEGLKDVVQISAGADFTCALRANGTVWCWGANCGGNLGQGDTAPHPTPVQVPGLSKVTTIGTGTHHTCARADDGLYCWGSNTTAQLGAGVSDMMVSSPVHVIDTPGLVDVVQIAGSVDATCALTSSGEVYCWGRGDFGFIGDGSIHLESCPNGGNACAPSPTKALLSGVVEIGVGYETAVARLASGALMAWGSGQSGLLGDGVPGQTASSSPVQVVGFP